MPALYKFVADPEVAQFFLRGEVKFTPIPELNDPSELTPSMSPDEVGASLARLRRNGYTDEDMVQLRRQESLLRTLAPQRQARPVPGRREEATAIIRSPLYDSYLVLERLLGETAREMSSKVGLFCLSQRFDSLPLWAHYARNASGMVVEFRNLDQVFLGDDTGVMREVVPVRYERERYGVTFDPRSHESLFFAKFQDWRYEQEVRVVMPLSECREYPSGGKVLYFYDVPSTCIARFILGCNMTPEKTTIDGNYVHTT